VDPGKVALASAMRERPPSDPSAPFGPAAVLRTGRSELYPDLPDALLAQHAVDEQHLLLARAAGMTSAMLVPLRARGHVLGVVTFVAAGPRRRYGEADLAMAEELARYAGLALDNARLFEEAQRAIRARDDVLAIVSHDLKNPLESVTLSAALLLRAPESPRVRRYAEAVQRSAARMDRLIRELLDLSSMEAGRFRVEKRPQPLEPVVAEALAVLSPLAAEKSITIGIEGLPLGEAVPLDRERVLQVISNLLGNAVQFAPAGGRVVVRARLGPEEARVEVQDDGPGIARDDLPHVFDRFWKSGSLRGTGLGLSIARGVVEAHAGRIWVESRVGAGSTFVFTLPR
jgi:signal transduction histidine kinase